MNAIELKAASERQGVRLNLAAAVNQALTAARAVSKRQTAPGIIQPELPTEGLELLVPSYLAGDIFVDLWGYKEENKDCEVIGVALAGTLIDLTSVLGARLNAMSHDAARWRLNNPQKNQD